MRLRAAMLVTLLLSGCGATALHLAIGGDVTFREAPRPEMAGPGLPALGLSRIPPEEGPALAIVNLEGTLAARARALPCPKGLGDAACVRLIAGPAHAGALAEAGVRLVSLANNHSLDAGREGLAETLEALGARGIRAAGASVEGDPWAPAILRLGPARVALLAATTVRSRGIPLDLIRKHQAWAPLPEALRKLRSRIRLLRDRDDADLILVSLHWGAPGARAPAAKQRRAARRLIEAGADLVFGHHAHRRQGLECWNQGWIAYGLGDLHVPVQRVRGRDGAILRLEVMRRGDRWRLTSARLGARPGACANDAPRPPWERR